MFSWAGNKYDKVNNLHLYLTLSFKRLLVLYFGMIIAIFSKTAFETAAAIDSVYFERFWNNFLFDYKWNSRTVSGDDGSLDTSTQSSIVTRKPFPPLPGVSWINPKRSKQFVSSSDPAWLLTGTAETKQGKDVQSHVARLSDSDFVLFQTSPIQWRLWKSHGLSLTLEEKP